MISFNHSELTLIDPCDLWDHILLLIAYFFMLDHRNQCLAGIASITINSFEYYFDLFDCRRIITFLLLYQHHWNINLPDSGSTRCQINRVVFELRNLILHSSHCFHLHLSLSLYFKDMLSLFIFNSSFYPAAMDFIN